MKGGNLADAHIQTYNPCFSRRRHRDTADRWTYRYRDLLRIHDLKHRHIEATFLFPRVRVDSGGRLHISGRIGRQHLHRQMDLATRRRGIRSTAGRRPYISDVEADTGVR